MKKLILTAAIVLSMGLGAFAQQGDGAFRRGGFRDGNSNSDATTPFIPNGFSYSGDVDGQTGDTTPIGSGIAVLMGLGAAYMVAKKRKED